MPNDASFFQSRHRSAPDAPILLINGLLSGKLLRQTAFKKQIEAKKNIKPKFHISMVAMHSGRVCVCNAGQECEDYKVLPSFRIQYKLQMFWSSSGGWKKEDLTATTELWTRWNIVPNFSWYSQILHDLSYGKIKTCHVWCWKVLENASDVSAVMLRMSFYRWWLLLFCWKENFQ